MAHSRLSKGCAFGAFLSRGLYVLMRVVFLPSISSWAGEILELASTTQMNRGAAMSKQLEIKIKPADNASNTGGACVLKCFEDCVLDVSYRDDHHRLCSRRHCRSMVGI